MQVVRLRSLAHCVIAAALASSSLLGCSGSTGDPDDEAAGSGGKTGGAAGKSSSAGHGGASGGTAGQGGAAGADELPPVSEPARPPLRRLTKAEWTNAVADLVGFRGDYADGFANDEEIAGYAVNSRAPVAPLQLENYQQAAEDAASDAVFDLGRLVPCAPPAAAEADCVDQFLRGFGKRAYRRPLADAELARYRDVFAAGKKADGKFGSGIALVVSTMLQSPYFLYRVEVGDQGAADDDGVPLTPYEVATRLSFLLYDSIPDPELFTAADEGKLRSTDEIATQVRRILAQSRMKAGHYAFFSQLLQTTRLSAIQKDPALFPKWNGDLALAMDEEVNNLVYNNLLFGDGRYETLLSQPKGYIRGGLYSVYNVPAFNDVIVLNGRNTDLPPAERAGLLTTAGVLAVHAHADQSAPVRRGLLVSRSLLCIDPPPPPPSVNNTPPMVNPNQTTRARFEQHRADPSCAVCHKLMDPFGIAFENYDALGQFRTKDGALAVDSASDITGSALGDGTVKNGVDLAQRLAKSPVVRSCLVKQYVRYLYGRADVDADAPMIDSVASAFESAQGRIPELLVALATSKPFRYVKPGN